MVDKIEGRLVARAYACHDDMSATSKQAVLSALERFSLLRCLANTDVLNLEVSIQLLAGAAVMGL
jgi:hypothetical protein